MGPIDGILGELTISALQRFLNDERIPLRDQL